MSMVSVLLAAVLWVVLASAAVADTTVVDAPATDPGGATSAAAPAVDVTPAATDPAPAGRGGRSGPGVCGAGVRSGPGGDERPGAAG